MKNKLFLAGICILALTVTSCNIQKRLYRDGWYVSGNNNNHESKNTGNSEVKNTVTLQPEVVTPTVEPNATTVEEIIRSTSQTVSTETVTTPGVSALPQAQTDPGHVSSNGDGVQQSTVTQETVVKEQKPASAAAAGSSQMVALLLCIFLGIIGIHRFYLGYYGIGVLMLLTLGVFGILWIIDLIRIVTGSLQPKGGSYSSTI